MKTTALNIGFKVVEPIILLDLLPMFGESSFFGGLFGCRGHVVESCEETTRLSCDDGNGDSPSKMMENESLLRVGDWATLEQRDVLSFCGSEFLE